MSSQSVPHSIANMEGLQSSIVRGEADRVVELLGSQPNNRLTILLALASQYAIACSRTIQELYYGFYE